ncbi:MAG TPA: hypothetical protein VGS12_16165 [Caulobacteraceae bacterium]|nr:hypothetical protein [Caulobacteraceae bacterium]
MATDEIEAERLRIDHDEYVKLLRQLESGSFRLHSVDQYGRFSDETPRQIELLRRILQELERLMNSARDGSS